jgi:DNA-binding MarR family transcriptional regulator
MGATLARLAEGGYITRTHDAEDGRRSTIAIARRGRQVILAGRAERQGWLARAIDGTLDPGEQRTLASAIACLRRLSAS